MIMRAKWVTLGGFAIAFANCVYGQPSQAASLLSNSGVECGFGTANVGKSCTMQELQGMGGATGTGSITIGDVKFNQFASDNGALGNTMSVAPFEVPSEPNLVGLYLYPTNPANNPWIYHPFGFGDDLYFTANALGGANFSSTLLASAFTDINHGAAAFNATTLAYIGNAIEPDLVASCGTSNTPFLDCYGTTYVASAKIPQPANSLAMDTGTHALGTAGGAPITELGVTGVIELFTTSPLTTLATFNFGTVESGLPPYETTPNPIAVLSDGTVLSFGVSATGIPTVDIPEPIATGIFGVAVLSIGLVHRRRGSSRRGRLAS